MSDTCDDCGRHFFEYGDRVRLVQNHMLTGQVVGEKNWHTEYLVRVGATVSAIWFNDCELEPDPDFSPIRGEVEPADNADDGNVVHLKTFKQGRA